MFNFESCKLKCLFIYIVAKMSFLQVLCDQVTFDIFQSWEPIWDTLGFMYP